MKNPKHPVTKKELVGGFNPLDVSQRPFGYRATIAACETPRACGCVCVKPAGHDGFHEEADGTEFTNSGKVGLGKVGHRMRRFAERATA